MRIARDPVNRERFFEERTLRAEGIERVIWEGAVEGSFALECASDKSKTRTMQVKWSLPGDP